MKKDNKALLVGDTWLVVMISCSEANTIGDENVLTRSDGVNDSGVSDFGNVRYGNMVVDTTWSGETHIGL